jgi:dihydroorotase
MPRNTKTITLQKVTQKVPEELPFAETVVVPLRAGETIAWSLAE